MPYHQHLRAQLPSVRKKYGSSSLLGPTKKLHEGSKRCAFKTWHTWEPYIPELEIASIAFFESIPVFGIVDCAKRFSGNVMHDVEPGLVVHTCRPREVMIRWNWDT